MPEVDSGDLLAVMSAGAYGFVMASNYNSRPRAAEVLVNGAEVHVIRERDNFEDIIRGEKIVTLKGGPDALSSHLRKMHGCGNDYVYVVADRMRPADPAALARRVSDRRFGIGGDGLIMLCPSSTADVRMEMYNADGSRGEMCGNGIRCVARLHYELSGGRKNPHRGRYRLRRQNDRAQARERPRSCRHRRYGRADSRGPRNPGRSRRPRHRLSARSRRPRIERITAVSMGNPHCVVFVNGRERIQPRRLRSLRGSASDSSITRSSRAASTPNSFCRSRANRLRMRVWERGSGETLACGTGACAALVAAVLTGRAERSATVELRGGNLEIEWRERWTRGESRFHDRRSGRSVQRRNRSRRRRTGRPPSKREVQAMFNGAFSA